MVAGITLCLGLSWQSRALQSSSLLPSLPSPLLVHCDGEGDVAIAVSNPSTMWETLGSMVWAWWWSLMEGVRIVNRSAYLALIFTPPLLTSPLLLFSRDGETVQWWWSLLRTTICRSGPCNIKFSQWIATRPDLFPLAVCQQLQDLQTNASRCSWGLTKQTLEAMFGAHWSEMFSLEIDPNSGEPVVVGSGCVAQVLKGQLLQPLERAGLPVAIKVIHPTVAVAIQDDLRIMRFAARLLESVPSLSQLGLLESVEEFALFMNSQLDLRREAAALSRFRANFSTRPGSKSPAAGAHRVHSVHFPEPIYPLVTPLALVETYAEGQLMLDLIGSIDAPTRHQLATLGLDTILKMVFQDNFIHADMHMGNIIVLRDVEANSLKMTMIDAGLVAELEPQDRLNFVDLFKAVVLNDGRRVGRLIIERSRNLGYCKDAQGFEAELEDVVRTVHSSGLSLGRMGVGALLQRVLVACHRHNVKLESKFVAVVLAIGVVEGLGRRLDPDVDILLKASPYVLKASLDLALQGASRR